MKALWVWLCSVAVMVAAETAAWRVPIEMVVNGDLGDLKIVSRLAEPPGESAFFEEGDELWDLSNLIRFAANVSVESDQDPFAPAAEQIGEIIQFAGEWAVWNARSKMIVARGDWADLHAVESWINLEEQPKVVTVEFDLKVNDLVETVSISARSGEKASGQLGDFHMQIAPNVGTGGGWIDLNLLVGVNVEDGNRRVTSAVSLKRGVRQRIAGWVEAGNEGEIGVRADAVTVFGVPSNQIKIYEQGRQLVSRWDSSGVEELDRMKIGEGVMVRVFEVPPNFLDLIASQAQRIAVGPLQVPEGLSGRITGVYLDVASVLKINGVRFSNPLAMAGYDPDGGVLVVVNDASNLDLVTSMLMNVNCHAPRLVELIYEWGAERLLLVTRSGDKGVFEKHGRSHYIPLLKVTPHVKSNEAMLDVDYSFRSSDESIILTSSATLLNGVSLDIGSIEGEKKIIRLTGNVLHPKEAD